MGKKKNTAIRLTLNSTAAPCTRTQLPTFPSSNLLKTSEAAVYLTVQPTTLEQWRWTGRGPRFVKIGRSCRYRISDLEDFLEARVFSSTTEAQTAA